MSRSTGIWKQVSIGYVGAFIYEYYTFAPLKAATTSATELSWADTASKHDARQAMR